MQNRQSRSGPNIPEAQRKTVQRKLRLAIDADAKLLELVRDGGYDRDNQISGTVEALILSAWEEWRAALSKRRVTSPTAAPTKPTRPSRRRQSQS